MGWFNHQLAMNLSHYFFQGFGIHPNGGGLALHGISEALKMVFLSFYYTLENEHGSWTSPVWKGSSSSKPSFLGSMLIFRGVSLFLKNPLDFGGGVKYRPTDKSIWDHLRPSQDSSVSSSAFSFVPFRGQEQRFESSREEWNKNLVGWVI